MAGPLLGVNDRAEREASAPEATRNGSLRSMASVMSSQPHSPTFARTCCARHYLRCSAHCITSAIWSRASSTSSPRIVRRRR